MNQAPQDGYDFCNEKRVCDSCHYSTTNQLYFKRHFSGPCNVRPLLILCTKCGYRLTNVSALRTHLRFSLSCGEEVGICDTCDTRVPLYKMGKHATDICAVKILRIYDSYKSRFESYWKNGAYHCPNCPYSGTVASYLGRHLNNKWGCQIFLATVELNQYLTAKGTFQCPFCPYETTKGAAIKSHVDDFSRTCKRKDRQAVVCDHCLRLIRPQRTSVFLHWNRKHNPSNNSLYPRLNCYLKGGNYCCPKCPYSNPFINHFSQHLKSKSGCRLQRKRSELNKYKAIAEAFKCPKCAFETSSAVRINTHLRSKQGCKKTFSTKYTLRKHLGRHICRPNP